MTKQDVSYLLTFLTVLGMTILFVSSGHWLAASIPGILVLLFVCHMVANLAFPPSSGQVASLLGAAIDPDARRSVLNGNESDDYSEWETFCDTPIINNRRLNRVRVTCHMLLHDDTFFRWDPVAKEMTITDEGTAALRSLLQGLGTSACVGGVRREP